MYRSTILCCFIVFCMPLLAGCGHGDRCPVSGTVTLDGQPLAEGSINFRPAGGTKGNSAGAAVIGGKYAIESDRGLKPGEYNVVVESSFKTGRKINDPQKGIVDELRQVNYREEGRLKATVTAGNNPDLDFAITTR